MCPCDVKTIVLPRCSAEERAADDGGSAGSQHERRREAARLEMLQYLAAGHAVELVSARPHRYAERVENTAGSDS